MLNMSMALIRKDLTLLLQRGSGLIQALILGLILVFVFSLSQEIGEKTTSKATSTIFWLSSAFCQVLVFNQLYALEEGNNSRLGLILSPCAVQGVWLGKAISGLILILCAQIIFLPAVIIFLGQEFLGNISHGILAIILVDIGMCALGSLLGALAQGQSARESLLSIVLFPLLMPLLLSGISLLSSAFTSGMEEGMSSWLGIACAFDGIFLGAGILLFGYIYTGDE